MKTGTSTLLSLMILCSAAIFMTAPFIGSQPLNYADILIFLNGDYTASGQIFFKIRLPRVILGFLAGAALAVCGVVFQALLRNPLATPYTLGVASGSAAGALLMIKIGAAFTILGFSARQSGAFIGSLLTMLVVYALARRFGRISIHTLILAGVTINYFFSAVILILHYVADFTETRQMIRWTIGGLDLVDYPTLLRSLLLLIPGFILFAALARSFNLLSTSEEIAQSKGVAVNRIQIVAYLAASLVTANVVALTGPIGFIGLIVPHLLRMLLGPDHRLLIPTALLGGGGFLVIADTVARTILAPVDLPVGIVTTLLGGPFFLWLLAKKG